MRTSIRRAVAVTAGTGALLVASAFGVVAVASADTGSDGDTPGSGSGLSGGPTHTQVAHGVDVPLQDPTLGEGTALPPAYNAFGAAG
ncbi:MAG TPA: hypothetical protein VGH99_10660 [Pseudonocardia sp.]|jgi:hypothetical protein